MEYEKAKAFILDKMKTELPHYFFYHSVEHSLDVLNSAMHYAESENINEHDKILLATAAVFHDSGFIFQSHDHEEKGCELAKGILVNYKYSEKEIAQICGMIMSTKLPQTPVNKLEQIMCDADLDYLGRDDFFKTGHKLFEEFSYLGVVKNEKEWNELQLHFFESHHYFTQSAIRLRQKQKQVYYQLIKEKLTS